MGFWKNAYNEIDARHTRKRSPQFALANEELRLSKYNAADARYVRFFSSPYHRLA